MNKTKDKLYCVYVHVFPNKKKYVGKTSKPLRARWDGGLGYAGQWDMCNAVLKYGWDNIKHYIVADGLCEHEAALLEAYLIKKWKTCTKSYGYNMILPAVDGLDSFNPGEIKIKDLKRVDDNYEKTTVERFMRRQAPPNSTAKRIRLVETGEVFENVKDALVNADIVVSGKYGFPREQSLYQALRDGIPYGKTPVTYEDGFRCVAVPAHWEYVDTEQ